jgi:hypothetical protein
MLEAYDYKLSSNPTYDAVTYMILVLCLTFQTFGCSLDSPPVIEEACSTIIYRHIKHYSAYLNNYSCQPSFNLGSPHNLGVVDIAEGVKDSKLVDYSEPFRCQTVGYVMIRFRQRHQDCSNDCYCSA